MTATCEECNKEVSAKVEAYSKDHFKGKILCYDCQKSARGKEDSWTYERPEESEEDKSEEDKSIVDVSETSEDKTQEDVSVKTEARKVDNETIRLVTDMPPQDKKEFYAWLKQKYGVDDLEPLNIDQKREVLEQTKTAVAKRDEEKGADVKQDANVKQEEDTKQPAQQEEKKIKIDWDNIPVQVLIPKLQKALEYQTIDDDGYTVKHTSGNHSVHKTTLDSCDCSDYVHRGTSINPCTHQVRIKYSDEEIREKLKELGAGDLQVKHKTQKDIVVSRASASSDMMIHGLSPRLAEIGKIKIGTLSDKMVKGRRLPEKLDHFVVTSLLRDDCGDLLIDEEMTKKIGNSCQELPIYLCYDDPSLNFTTFYGHFTQSRLQCMGNGITASRTLESGDKEEITCNPKTCEAYQKKQCKPYGRLSVILADASRVGGCYVLRTTSWNSIRNILTSMSFIRTITGGILAGIKLKMRLIPMQVQPRDMGRTVKIYTVNIEYGGSWEELKDEAAKEMRRRVQLGTNMKQIESGDREMIAEQVKTEAEEQAVEISQEFNPEEEG